MYNSELETGIIRGKRQTMLSVSRWIGRRVELARKSVGSVDSALLLELTLGALESLQGKIDRQVSDGVRTLDCSDFLPE